MEDDSTRVPNGQAAEGPRPKGRRPHQPRPIRAGIFLKFVPKRHGGIRSHESRTRNSEPYPGPNCPVRGFQESAIRRSTPEESGVLRAVFHAVIVEICGK